MATKFAEIYERAIFKMSAYDFLDMEKKRRESVLEKFLTSAQADFQGSCSVDLADRDTELEQYNQDLNEEEKEILALGIVFYWLSSKTIRSDLLKNVICNKDYTSFSPANLLKEVHSLRTEIKKEYKSRIREYAYRRSDLEKLKV